MEFDNLKSNWKRAGQGRKDQEELLMMTKVKNHPNIKRIRIKLIFETILIILFLAVYYDAFDGATKPFWANLLLTVAAISYIIVRFVGWLVLRSPIKGDNLKKSLMSFQNKLQRMAFASLLTSFLFGSAIILFFATTVAFTTEKYLVFAGMVLSLVLLVYLSSRNWFNRVESINTALVEFKDTADH